LESDRLMPIIIEPEVPSPGTGQTLEELMKEVFAQGFDDFEGDAEKETRVKKWLNIAYQEITLAKDWPFLELEWEGLLPEEFPNLGHILDVTSINNRVNLRPADRRQLIRWNPTLEESGNAIGEFWFQEGADTIAVYPTAPSETFRVRYSIFPTELTESTNEPIIPARWQYLIVDGAVMRAYRSRDAFSAAELVEANWAKGMKTMEKALLSTNHDRNKKIIRTQGSYSYGIGNWNG
jgi:hypothetical protein